ncbi:SDR family NAD(P)-dependent oxidoreductase [Pseudonocardia benzenivorans]
MSRSGLFRERSRPTAASRVLVTGAAGGFGAPTADRLRDLGAHVIGLDREGGDGVLACDVTDDAAVDRAVAAAVDRLGGLDAVVHYAGIGIPNDAGGPLHPDAMRVIDVNLLGAWRVTAAALPALQASARGAAGRRGASCSSPASWPTSRCRSSPPTASRSAA